MSEELWMYSKNRELLADEEDKQYLSENLNEIKKRIDVMIKYIETNASADMLSVAKKLCSAVYHGDSFRFLYKGIIIKHNENRANLH